MLTSHQTQPIAIAPTYCPRRLTPTYPSIGTVTHFETMKINSFTFSFMTFFNGSLCWYTRKHLIKTMEQFTYPSTDFVLFIPTSEFSGKKWHDTRTLLSPSFTSSKLKTMFSFIKQYAEDVAQHLVENDQDICVLEMKHLFSRVTNDLIATTSFGVNVDSIAEPDNTFYVMGKKVTDFTTLRVNLAVIGQLISPYFFKIFKLSLFANEVRSYFNDLINDIVKSREKNAIVRPDMIHLMLQAKSQNHAQENGHMDLAKGKSIEITNEDIAAQAMIFFFGGLDSTSSLMCFTAYELAVNRDIQGRLRREIRDTWEECQGSLTFDALSKMTYMDMVVSEVLRKWPNFLFTDRVCSKDYTIQAHGPEENSVYLKKGASILLPIYGIHHDPKHYPDPERFDPERFNDENKRKRHPYAYLPFGVGPRMCIGARFATIETKAIFFYILLHFEIVPVEETVIPVVASKKHFNLQPNDGLKLGLVRVSE